MTLPYENAKSGRTAIEDIRRTLLAFGCSKFAPMEDFDNLTVTIQFEWRGRMVQVQASGSGYAQAWLKAYPWSPRKRKSEEAYKRYAIEKGSVAVWSILRDWVKGQITAVETGILSFEAAFLGQILLPSGETVMQRIETQGLLPPPDNRKSGEK
jgi:hypothetical protein